MRILITGGFGYVGGRLGKHLAALGHEVYLGSRSPKSPPDWLKPVVVVEMDWNDEVSLAGACDKMDAVVHASGMNSVECAVNPALALEVNGMATNRLVQAAEKKLVANFIYLSSAHVYSSNLRGLITEDTELTNTHPYASSNAAGEGETLNHVSKKAMQTSVVRLANAFGAPLDSEVNCWMLVINDLCRQAARNKQLEVRGPSNIVRNFITMEDVCLAIEHLIGNSQKLLPRRIFNLGGRTKSLLEMAHAISGIYESERGVILPIKELSAPNKHVSDLDFRSLAFQKIGWYPTSNFRKELCELINFCEINFGSKK
jgi:UDP-glucose 4-epimerase